ncbi:MAG: dockerin type I repeat-containing protein [Oscillospiraceae bacterium]|jgi:hypothetical protein|nr:dockerin type I repeat-containing protein [Oscillospiraceae bacterium]
MQKSIILIFTIALLIFLFVHLKLNVSGYDSQEITWIAPAPETKYIDNTIPEINWLQEFTTARYSQLLVWKMSLGNFVANEVVIDYLGHSNLTLSWPDWSPMRADENYLNYTSLMEFPNNLSIIVTNNIPDEIVIKAFAYHNERFGHTSIGFTDEDIAALLTRCEATVLNHFADENAIVIEDRVYTMAWIYRNTAEGYKAVGITPEMIEERLKLLAEFDFLPVEATLAFESKLSQFLGRDIVLINERVLTTFDALTILRAIAGMVTLTDAQIARFDLNGDGVVDTADAIEVLRVVAGLA